VLLRTWTEFTQHSFADLLSADLVIANVDLLTKARYGKLPGAWKQIDRDSVAQHLVQADQFREWSPPYLEWLRWQCLLIDGVMELSTEAFAVLIQIQSCERWGLCSSLMSKVHLGTVRRLAQLLSGNRLPREPSAAHAFIQHCTMRWPSAPIFPRVRERTYGVQLSAQEQCAYLSEAGATPLELAEQLYAVQGIQRVSALPIESAAQSLIDSSDCLLELLEHRRTLCSDLAEELGHTENTGMRSQLLANLQRQQTDLAARCIQLKSARAFLQESLAALQQDQERQCLLCCAEGLPLNSFAIARCGHYCCVECMRKLLCKSQPCCAQCRSPLKFPDIFVLEEKGYGQHRQSKLDALVHFVREQMPVHECLLLVAQRKLLASQLCDQLRQRGISTQLLDPRSVRAGAQVLVCSVEGGVPGCATHEQAGYLAFAHRLQGDRAELEARFKAQLVHPGQKRKLVFISHFLAMGTLEDQE
jgi:hypothetical protein